MSDASSVVRTLLIYGVCLPLAIVLGYLLATPLDQQSMVMLGLLFATLTVPMFLRWHHVWLIAFWNASMFVPFVKGSPSVAMILGIISISISFLQHILNKRIKFLPAPVITWPLFFLAVVVLATAELRGGIGLRAAGGESYGGKRYLLVIGAIIGYFALTAKAVPFKKVKFYVCLFFLGGLTNAMANLAGVLGPGLYFLYAFFPVDPASLGGQHFAAGTDPVMSRLGGLAWAGVAMSSCIMAIYGITGIFQKYWRIGVLGISFVATFYGGFRGNLIIIGLTFAILFYLEGMMRSRLMPVMVVIGILLGAFLVGYSDRLPWTVQRTLSFLPIHVVPEVEADAKGSTEWRLDMWREVLPDVPKYLILGKGYAFDPNEMAMIQAGMTRGEDEAVGSALAGDYHSGPLSVIMPFGIWGVVGFLWLIGAGVRLLYQNYRYGDPALAIINRFCLAQFIAKVIFFLGIFGSLYSDLPSFIGLLGLSVCINGGVRRAASATVTKPKFKSLDLAPAHVVP